MVIFRTDLSSLAQGTMHHTQQAKNIQTKKDQNILAALNAPKPQDSPQRQGIPPFMNQNKPIAPDQKQQPVVVDKKIGRNDGMVQLIRYFECPQGHGIFIREEKLVVQWLVVHYMPITINYFH